MHRMTSANLLVAKTTIYDRRSYSRHKHYMVTVDRTISLYRIIIGEIDTGIQKIV